MNCLKLFLENRAQSSAFDCSRKKYQSQKTVKKFGRNKSVYKSNKTIAK